MPLTVIHDRLADTSALFVAALGIWALFLRFRSRPLDSSWSGAAIIAEVLLIAQVAIGTYLYFQGLDAVLPRPFMHILYGVVAILTIPASYSYFGNIEDENVQTLAMACVCLFLWGIVQRAGSVAVYLPPNL
jgi:hypothetical protein